MNNFYDKFLLTIGCSQSVIQHCKKVVEATEKFSNHSFINKDLVKRGAIFHDIGRSKTHSIAHAQIGAEMCRQMGLPEPVARIVECHIGAGLTSDECTLLRLAPRDCIPKTIEEKIVAHADNTVQRKQINTVLDNVVSMVFLNRKIRKRIYRLSIDMQYFSD